jgi:bacteriocin-like protein
MEVRMSIETNSEPALVELSDEELATVSGGFDISFSASMFEHSEIFSSQQSGRRRGRSMFRSSRTMFSSFQFNGSGFQSASEAMSFMSGIAKLFGR